MRVHIISGSNDAKAPYNGGTTFFRIGKLLGLVAAGDELTVVWHEFSEASCMTTEATSRFCNC